MKPAQILKKKINSGDLTIGAIATYHCWPGLVEMLVKAGFDYLIVDGEHGSVDSATVSHICDLGRILDFPILVRPPSVDTTLMGLALDAGAVGMLLPYVETLDDLEKVKEAIYLPPRGRRRPGGTGVRWVSGFDYDNWKKEVEDDLIILPQIESRRGLENAEAIAQSEITTAIAIGPYDLSADLGVCWDSHHPDLLKAVEHVRQAGRKAGKNMWMNGEPDDLKKRGFTFICAGEPIMVLQGALNDLGRRLKPTAPSAKSAKAQILS